MIARFGLLVCGAAATLGLSAAADAQSRKQPPGRPQVFEALIGCRSIADSAARLACFDKAAASMEEAASKRDLLLVDRQQAREAKRGLFGLDLPNLNLFGGGADDGGDEIKSIESTVASASNVGNAWVVRLADGSVWRQTDGKMLAIPPKAGHKVKVLKAALGSFMMRVNGQPAVRVKRQI
jgi:hypothetical protein